MCIHICMDKGKKDIPFIFSLLLNVFMFRVKFFNFGFESFLSFDYVFEEQLSLIAIATR